MDTLLIIVLIILTLGILYITNLYINANNSINSLTAENNNLKKQRYIGIQYSSSSDDVVKILNALNELLKIVKSYGCVNKNDILNQLDQQYNDIKSGKKPYVKTKCDSNFIASNNMNITIPPDVINKLQNLMITICPLVSDSNGYMDIDKSFKLTKEIVMAFCS
jgi:hypothetical protein